GKRKKSIMPQQDVDVSVFGDDEIWVTPKIPFLIPLTAGYFISFVLGDILYRTISLFL
ncbi:MAG: peptidase A24, partial [Thermoplasmata archaeon]|nr:peptidase A24 [Thermoplasmata archaeon]